MINPIRWIIARIRHWRYCRYLMYGNRESRKRDKEECR